MPVDEVVTLALYHREDENLSRLMLDEPERRALERLWEELWYVSQEALEGRGGLRPVHGIHDAGQRPQPLQAPRASRSPSAPRRCGSG